MSKMIPDKPKMPTCYEELPLKARQICAFLVREGICESEAAYVKEWGKGLLEVRLERIDELLKR